MNRRSDKPALRPATIPEQAAWRPLSVKRELQTENWPASANTDDTGPEDYILELGRVLISAQPKCRLGCAVQRPLLGVKRTWRRLVSMSAYDPNRTFTSPLLKRRCNWSSIFTMMVLAVGWPSIFLTERSCVSGLWESLALIVGIEKLAPDQCAPSDG